jgi:malto-oligosyltrehalose trehalohydrolase
MTARYISSASRLHCGNPREPSRAQLSKAQWNDDFHHALHVLVTGETDGYYIDYAVDPVAQTGRVLAEGFAFQGEPSAFGGDHPRGEISRHLPPTAFINFLQNHDQIGNRAMGERLAQLADPQKVRAALSVLLLSPSPPLLFMGEEYAAPEPFLYFCEYEGDLATAITNGRRAEFGRFRGFDSPTARERIPDPNAAVTCERSCLDWEKRDEQPHRDWLQFTRQLLRLRHEHVVPLIPSIVAGKSTFVAEQRTLTVHWPLSDGRCLSLRANFESSLAPAPPMQGALLYAAHDISQAAIAVGPWEVQLWLR